MHFIEALDKNLIEVDLKFTSKKRALEVLSARVAEQYPTLTPAHLFEALLARERLGSTSIGRGIAIPHCRADSIDQCIAGLFRLSNTIHFDPIDNVEVNLIILLVIPQEETKAHLELLANIAECFNNKHFCTKIHKAETADEIYQLIVEYGR